MITKTTMVVIFNSQNSHLLTLFLPTEEVFQVNGLNRPVANLPVVDFHSAERNAERNANTKATEYVTFDFSCPFRKVWTSLSISDRDFFLCLVVRIRESFDKQLVLRIVKALLFIHQLDQAAPKASDVAAADWLYQDTWKNTIFFHACWYSSSQGRISYSWAIELNTRREIHFYARPSIILCLIKTCLTGRLHALRFSFHFAFFRLMKNYQKHTKKAVGQ